MHAATFYAGARLVEAEKTTFADVFRVFFVMTLAAFAVSQSSSFAPDTGKAMSYVVSVFAILDRKSEIDPNDESGYDTVLGERDIEVSGGQKQRVVIARAIVKSPKILLLDVATSALDAKSERVLQDALDKVMVNRTTVVVAHRLSTIKGTTDVIVVTKNGVFVEKGKHEDLINIKEGFYATLVALH
ncbi:ABC transporter B family member 21-like protein [Tanacetum coccineum]